MTKQDMVDFVRLQIHIQDPHGTILVDNEDYLRLTDEQIVLFMRVAMSKKHWRYDLEIIPGDAVYPLMLLTKREVFVSLAAKVAPDYDMTADNNNVLREHQMFQAYLALIREIDRQYAEYLEQTDAGATLTTYDATVNTRYYTKRNYDRGVAPALYVRVLEVFNDRVMVSWEMTNANRFQKYEVRVGIEPTYLLPENNNPAMFNGNARMVAQILDKHQTMCKVTGLAPDVHYFLSVCARERNAHYGVHEVEFTTTKGR